MVLFFKKLLKRLFLHLGLDIRLVRKHKQIISPEIVDPVLYNQQASMEAFYKDAQKVRTYVEYMQPFYEHVVELLEAEVPDWKGKQVADLGCGTGEVLLRLRQKHPDCLLAGYEYSEAALAVARRQVPEAHLSWFDVYIPVAATYEIVICTEVLEHLLYPEKALLAILQAISFGGFALLTVPDGRQDAYAGHIHYWSPQSWLLFLHNHAEGWEIETGLFHFGTKNYAILRSKNAKT